jgi:hypothetical protein
MIASEVVGEPCRLRDRGVGVFGSEDRRQASIDRLAAGRGEVVGDVAALVEVMPNSA